MSEDDAYGQKRRDFYVGGCGVVGCGSGAGQPDACTLPPLLPFDGNGLRFVNGRGTVLLPIATFK
jgi:hypothetical protein